VHLKGARACTFGKVRLPRLAGLSWAIPMDAD
jgi:hypothetical protein